MEKLQNQVAATIDDPPIAQAQPLETPTPVQEKKPISKIVRFTLIGAAVIFLGALTHFTWWYFTKWPEVQRVQDEQAVQQQNPAPILEEPEGRPQYTDIQFSWEIFNADTGVPVIERTEYDTQVVYKAPFLYFKESRSLVQLNLETGERKILHTESDSEEISRSINAIQLVNDILFFTTGEYLQGGALFYLNEAGEVKQIDEHEMLGGGRIEERAGKYWLIGGEGDSCWGQSRYSLLTFDPLPVVTPKVESHVGCNDGEEVITILSDKFLMTEHTTNEEIPAMGFTASEYGAIFTRSIQNPQEKTELVAATSMPKQVVQVLHHEDKNQLWLLGNEPAVYDIGSNQVRRFDKPVPFTPQNWGSGEWSLTETDGERMEVSETGYCVEQYRSSDRSLIKGYVLNFNDLKIEDLTANCPQETFPERDYDAETKKHIENAFAALKLPAKYKLGIIEKEVVY